MKAHSTFLSIIFFLSTGHTPVSSRERPAATAAAETSWTIQSGGTSAALYAVHAVSQNVAWVSGAGGIVLRTEDEGVTWTAAGAFGADSYTVAGLDSNTALVGTTSTVSTARIWKTTNGGTSWALKDSVSLSASSLQMVTRFKGYYLASTSLDQYIRRTTDGGETWSPYSAGFIGEAVYELFWYDSLYGWFGTNNRNIYRTTTGGSGWQGSSTTFVNSYSLYFTSAQLGLAGSDTGPLNRSTDGGGTWTTGPAALPGPVLSLSGVSGTQEFWAVAGLSLYYTSNAGNTWTNASPGGTQQINSISMVTEGSNVFGWAVGNSGSILHYRRITTDINEGDQKHPSYFRLEQNYPNPFNPTTKIGFQLTGYGWVLLRVYDVLGREVATLVNEEKAPGTHEVTWNAGNVASGIYLCRIQAGTFMSMRKMLVVK